MSGIKANRLKLYDEADPSKVANISVEGNVAFFTMYKEAESKMPADRTFYPISMAKLQVDGIADVRTYAEARKAQNDATDAALTSESAARAAGDVVLDTKIGTETAARTAADSANAALIGTEQAARIAADQSLQAQHDARAASVDASLAAESKARADADIAADAKIGTETAARVAGDAALQSSIDGLTSGAAAESKAREDADTALDTKITAETAARVSDVADLQSQITNILSNTDAIALNSLAEIVADYQSVDAGHVARLVLLESQVAELLSFHS
jgi:hypothetical protein